MQRAHTLLLGILMLSMSSRHVLLAREDTGGTWQGGDPPPRSASAPVMKPATSHEDWLVTSTGQQARGRGGLGKNLMEVRFLGNVFGIAAGHMGIYRTVDGGLTWTKLTGPQAEAGYDHLLVTSRKDIWVANQVHPGGQPGWGHLYRSRNGGSAWEEVMAGQLAYSVILRDAGGGRIWAVSYQGPSYVSAVGGESWGPLNFGMNLCIRDVCIVGNGAPYDWAAYVVGFTAGNNAGTVLKSVDGGKNWRKLELPLNTPMLTRGYFVDQMRGWVAGDGVLLATEDGGQTWQPRTSPSPAQSLAALLFFQNGCGWIACHQPFDGIGKLLYEHTLFSTRDGGRNWRPVLSGWKSVNGFWSNGPGTCWAVGNTPGFTANDLVAIWNGKW